MDLGKHNSRYGIMRSESWSVCGSAWGRFRQSTAKQRTRRSQIVSYLSSSVAVRVSSPVTSPGSLYSNLKSIRVSLEHLLWADTIAQKKPVKRTVTQNNGDKRENKSFCASAA